ncbi:aldehyde:ferredoxin oxidoreductase [Halalkaliarchaeum desulfuricum]|uniref:Aldehyde:ferredoxin oxidoreductase n=1 Tax=Halalkaliarchaeum desulfuricum TaxID=2055893 RepID=A0A343TMF3_9EURY|nr:aldehyde ferredoxin oxidoreductase C-terminal domain-containing protein [Halalkaliarchaeum desulfuricum]AUX10275.1 aldehyde:ferredoxin oxidoreductase [Halalkaliarchaeum desulfuricum]
MPQGGYAEKLVEVNLTTGEITELPFPDDDVLKEYVGCSGLGLHLLYDRIEPGIDPLDPENPMVLTTGPLTGLPMVPAATNATITTLNGDTGFTAGRSHSHGWFGPRLKRAGYDGIVITGSAEEWTSLVIENGDIQLRDARDLVGADTHETEDLLKEELGYTTELPGEMSVAAIGPAGENLCDGSLIENDKNHSFSHSGVGQIMGSKKLKAIGVRGTGEVPIHDEDRLREVTEQWHENLEESTVYQGLADAGIPSGEYEYPKETSMTVAKNMLEVPGPDHEWGQGMSDHDIDPRPCFGCPVGCSYDFEYVEGPNEGYVATPAGGGENLEGSASIVGVYDTDWVHYLTDQCDRLGFESSGIGASMAVLIEAYQEGLIDEEDTDGIELEWGDPELVERLLEMAAHREGTLGEVLAEGPGYAADWAGGDAHDRAIHVKDSGMNLHDWRATWGIMLGQIVGPSASWPAPGADAWGIPHDAGYEEFQDPFDWKEKPKDVVNTWPVKYWDDANGTCWFGTWGVPDQVELSAQAVSAATGWEFTREDALEVGERLVHFERGFGARFGHTAEDDLDVPDRIVEEPPEGLGAGKEMKKHLEWMVREVYRLNDWDEKTGKPQRSTLEEVGLEKVADDIWA